MPPRIIRCELVDLLCGLITYFPVYTENGWSWFCRLLCDEEDRNNVLNSNAGCYDVECSHVHRAYTATRHRMCTSTRRVVVSCRPNMFPIVGFLLLFCTGPIVYITILLSRSRSTFRNYFVPPSLRPPLKQFNRLSVLLVSAHPDDECMFFGGSLLLCACHIYQYR